MDRKKFIQAVVALPFISIPVQSLSKVFGRVKECATQQDAEGPFYKPNAPMRVVIETEGLPLHIEGHVFGGINCDTPVSNAILDVWHCDHHGNYDMQGDKGRGQVRTDLRGYYRFTTIYPPLYGNRPRHIHIKVRAEGRSELTTQLYFRGDPNLRNDFARNAEEGRVIALQKDKNLRKGVFNIYL